MTTWLNAIPTLAAPTVLVTVASAQGSTPREAGAKMLVSADLQFDTIGGGHLELRACEIARAMLQNGQRRHLERFALGPGLGQCCGGAVQLLFERIDEIHDLHRLAERLAARRDVWRAVPLDADDDALLLDREGRMIGAKTDRAPGFDPDLPCRLLKDANGKTWLIDPCRATRNHLVLFGAGHVGAALVRALAELPCHVTWVDEREELFPAEVPANVQIECTDTPQSVAEQAAPGTSFLVMTHSHALDQALAETILRRREAGWFGLIGSDTKRAQFERRLREHGIGEERIRTMVCPIGIPGIAGKAPAVVAASVCAQLLQVWEAANSKDADNAALAKTESESQ
ncbi:MAG TPA: xanthine dehydrogenase accessory protein XdhC [Noviherbaspirillum sp.]|nr:xanthine dehydrogenase accessory protein XdhC [Noviherbaspirillum sp.]